MNVIITGASKGIGRALAMKFASAGYTLFLCARNLAALEKTSSDIKSVFPSAQVHTLSADLSVKEQVAIFGNFCLQIATPDILINNAGAYLPGKIIDEEDGVLDKMMSINFFSAYNLTRKLLPSMIKNGKGHIFNLCSVAGLKAYEGGGSYSISKFALNGLNQNLRNELMGHGIKVTGVFPGAVMTDSWGDFDNSNKRIMEASDIAEMIYASTQLSSQAVVEDIVIRPLLGDL